jgi:hypothetical protein
MNPDEDSNQQRFQLSFVWPFLELEVCCLCHH